MRGPRTKLIRNQKEKVTILQADVDPYKFNTIDEYLQNLTTRLELKQKGLSEILSNIEYNTGIHPKYLHKTVNEIKHAIQPYVSGMILWSYNQEAGVCSYCGEYMTSSSCEGCGSRAMTYDTERVNEIYLNTTTNSNKQVHLFLSGLSGHVNYSYDDWMRIKEKLDNHFSDYNINQTCELIGGVLPSTNAIMMKDAMNSMKESITDPCVYYACLYYWRWKVFDFSRYTNVYVKYVAMIDLWCNSNGRKINKMFKYYWISLIIGFDISKHYFRIKSNETFCSMKSLSRMISRDMKIPIPRSWKE